MINFRSVIAACAVLCLTSCLDLETSIRISSKGDVRAKLVYSLPAPTAQYGRGFGADEPWPLPLTEKDFIRRSLNLSGVRVTSYRVKTLADDTEQITVKLRADSPERLSAYLGIDMEITETADLSEFSLTLPSADEYQNAGPEFQEQVESLTDGAQFRFAVRPPKRPSRVSSGTIEGRLAVLELAFSDVLNGRAPQSWVVEW